MTEGPVSVPDYRERFRAIESRLGEAAGAETRDGLKRDIITLFKEVDGALGELTRLKDEQAAYIGVTQEGPYKPDYYRY